MISNLLLYLHKEKVKYKGLQIFEKEVFFKKKKKKEIKLN
jgi:hypothetical protein